MFMRIQGILANFAGGNMTEAELCEELESVEAENMAEIEFNACLDMRFQEYENAVCAA